MPMIDGGPLFWYNLTKRFMTRTNESRHPSSDPHFDAKREHVVWYLSHPLAPDEKYTFQQNMEHVVKLLRICYEEGVMAIAPYHTICIALEDENPEWRRMGLECDCNVARKLGYLLLTGHKLSSGMRHEMEQALRCSTGGIVRNLVGYNDEEVRLALRALQNGGRAEVRTEVP